MKVVVHGGADRIGGSCIEIASATTRIILDCGWPLEEEAVLTPPPVPGLFAPGEPPDAVLLSHAHPDHTGFIKQITAKVPIYATADTSKIMKVGSIYVPDAVQLPQDCFQKVSVPRSWREPIHSFDIGDFRITAYPVDHSSPGAVGYLVENDGKCIFYTGDLRFHGRKPGMHKRILKDLHGKLDLLITEGTNIGRKQSGLKSEEEVETQAVSLSRECQSLVLVAYSPQNIDRFVSYFNAARQAQRTFVCDHYQAAVLHQLNKGSLPKPSHTGLRVYLPLKRRSVKAYEDRFGDAIIGLDEILAAPERFTMLVRPSMIQNDLNGRLPPKARLLYGMWSGYRANEDWQQTEQVLASSSGEVIECHASGHAHAPDLFEFIERLRPKQILPVHTESAIAFHQRFGAKCVNSPFSLIRMPDLIRPLEQIRRNAVKRFLQGGCEESFRQMEQELARLIKGCESILEKIREAEQTDFEYIKKALRSPSLLKLRSLGTETTTTERQKGRETLFERNLISQTIAQKRDQACEVRWFNQTPIWSGLFGGNNTAHLDLVRQRGPHEFAFIELKIPSNDIAYSLAEVVSSAIGCLFIRELEFARTRLVGTQHKRGPLMNANRVTCVVLAPRTLPISEDDPVLDTRDVQKWCTETNNYFEKMCQRLRSGTIEVTAECWRMDIDAPKPFETVEEGQAWIESLGSLIDLVAGAESTAIRGNV